MIKNNRVIWNKIEKARKLSGEVGNIKAEIFEQFSEDELNISLSASNSDNLEETINCYIDYEEDGEKIFEYLRDRK